MKAAFEAVLHLGVKKETLMYTPSNMALIVRTPTERSPQFTETAISL